MADTDEFEKMNDAILLKSNMHQYYTLKNNEYALRIGIAYYNGKGVKENKNIAFKYFKKAEGYTNEVFQYLGFCYFYGYGVEKSDETALHYFELSVSNGYNKMLVFMLTCYMSDQRTTHNYAKAFETASRMKEENICMDSALNALALMYRHGYGVSVDLKKAFEYYTLNATEYNDVTSQVMLAKHYHNGDGVVKDRYKAYEYLIKAYKNGSHSALKAVITYHLSLTEGAPLDDTVLMNYITEAISIPEIRTPGIRFLGECYFFGRGVERDYKLAWECFNEVPDDHISARYLKIMINTGNKVTLMKSCRYDDCYTPIDIEEKCNLADEHYARQEYTESIRLYSEATLSGYAVKRMGDHFYYGYGVEKNISEAIAFYNRAVDSRNPDALAVISQWYYLGLNGYPQDITQAMGYAKLASLAGDVHSKQLLGFGFYTGYGVKQNTKEGIYWLTLHAEDCDDIHYTEGLRYYLGVGGKPCNYEKAIECFSKCSQDYHLFLKDIAHTKKIEYELQCPDKKQVHEKKKSSKKKSKQSKTYDDICMLTLCLIKVPVMADDGVIYEKYAISKWIEMSIAKYGIVLSPATGKPMGDFLKSIM